MGLLITHESVKEALEFGATGHVPFADPNSFFSVLGDVSIGC